MVTAVATALRGGFAPAFARSMPLAVNTVGVSGFRWSQWIPLESVDSVGVGGFRWSRWIPLESVDFRWSRWIPFETVNTVVVEKGERPRELVT